MAIDYIYSDDAGEVIRLAREEQGRLEYDPESIRLARTQAHTAWLVMERLRTVANEAFKAGAFADITSDHDDLQVVLEHAMRGVGGTLRKWCAIGERAEDIR